MYRLRAALATVVLLAVLAALSGCGSSGPAVRTGGTLRGEISAPPDSLDPALGDTREARAALWLVATPLLTHRHEAGQLGTEVIGGLASSRPSISPNGRVYTLTLRPGLRYSDGTPVRASDFERAIQRVLTLHSPGRRLYLAIRGARAYMDNGVAGADIPGIRTNDATGEITIELTRRVGGFSAALALPFAAPVPRGTPFQDLSRRPPPGAGPYRIEAIGPEGGFTLVRNRRWQAVPGITRGRAKRIEVRVVPDRRTQVRDVLANRTDWLLDPPPAALAAAVARQAGRRDHAYVANSTLYLFLDQRRAPLRDERVRRAIGLAVDRRALERSLGGLLRPTCNLLPPDMIGYVQVVPCPFGAPGSAPDLARARRLVRAAGARGARVTVWGASGTPTEQGVRAAVAAMRSIGLRAGARIVAPAVAARRIGDGRHGPAAGVLATPQQLAYAGDVLEAVDGAAVRPAHNPNPGHVADPHIDELLAAGRAIPDVERAAGRFARADRLAVLGADVVPLGNPRLTRLVSDRVDLSTAIAQPLYGIDLSRLGLRR